jgi:hypothetical protein
LVRSDASTPEQYLAELSEDRRELVAALRDAILENLPHGYEETMNWGMLSYEVPLGRYPDTYNGKPLSYAALAAQKNYVSLYLMGVYGDPDTEAWFHERYRRSGKRLDMGKSCVRFKKLDDVPLDVVAEVVGRWSLDDFIARYESSRGSGGK